MGKLSLTGGEPRYMEPTGTLTGHKKQKINEYKCQQGILVCRWAGNDH